MTQQEFPERYLPTRLVLALVVATLLQAAVCLVVAARLPELLPQAALLVNLAAMALAAPLFAADSVRGSAGLMLSRLVFIALWQGALAGYFLLIATRLQPLEPGMAVQAALVLALINLAVLLLACNFPVAFPGLVFVWFIALPVAAYFFAELALPPGEVSFSRIRGPYADVTRGALHWLLNLTPLTAGFGALTGTLPDGSSFSLAGAVIFLGGLDTALLLALMLKMRPAATVKTPAVEAVSA